MRRQLSSVSAQGVFRLPEAENDGAAASDGFSAPSSVNGSNSKRGTHLLSYNDFCENNNDEYLTLFDGEGSGGIDGPARPVEDVDDNNFSHSKAIVPDGHKTRNLAVGRQRANTANIRDPADNSHEAASQSLTHSTGLVSVAGSRRIP